MAREKSAVTSTTTTRETQRITSLEAREGKMLTSLEENVVRMHHGVSVKAEAQLPTNGVTEEVMGELLEMEVRAFEETGRADDLDDIPEGAEENERTSRIVAELKKKL
jgi:hypothetical protein